MKRLARILTIVCLALGPVGVGTVGMQIIPAHAATILTVSDCTDDSGTGTLRAAVTQANADYAANNQNADTITFSCSGTITLASTLTIAGSMVVDGSGHTVVVDGNNAVRLFSVSPAVSVGLSHLTLQHGNSGDGHGGAILNSGTVTITDSTLSNNVTGLFRFGGAIYNTGTLSISGGTFANNSATDGSGGVIFNRGTVAVTGGTFTNNSATYGGTIENAGTLTITSSTFANNSANTGLGGAISNDGTATITGSTFANNSANGGGDGGAIFNQGTAAIGATIVVTSSPDNCAGARTLTDAGYNLEDDAAASCGFSSTKHDLVGSSADLGALTNNGGPTETMALLSASPAIDVIPTTSPLCQSPTTDQRGVPRPMGTKCDIGAYEYAGNGGAFASGCPDTAQFRADLVDGIIANGGVFFFTCSSDDTLNTEADGAGSFVFSGELALVGNGGPGKVTLDGSGTDHIFSMSPGVSFGLSHLTLQDGSASSGGAVDNTGALTIVNSTLSGNSSANGGAVFNESGGMMTISNSTLSDNSASGGSGGAIENAGTMSIIDSTLSDNSAHSGGNSGAIVNVGGGSLSVTASTLSGNSADFTSGAITNARAGTTTITDSTIWGNTVGANGSGGITNLGGGTMTFGGSIIANSTGGNCANGGAFVDLGYNLSDDSTCGLATADHDQINTNPQLGPLANNGGSTQSMALAPTSPAIDANSCAISADQRGDARPDSASETGSCDIGAYEFQGGTSTRLISSSLNNTSNLSQPVTFTATVSSVDPTVIPAGSVTFQSGGTAITGCAAVALNSSGQATCMTASLAAGTRTIAATYAPTAGTDFTTSSDSITQTVNDLGPPTTTAALAGTSGSNGWFRSSVTVTLSATDPDGAADVATTYYAVDTASCGNPTGSTTACSVYNATSKPTIGDGKHTLYFFSVDQAGNAESQESQTVNVDTQPPTITYSGNTGPYTVDQQVAITCTAADQAGLSGVNPATNTCQDISGPAYDFTIGTNGYSAQAYDYAGNKGTGSTSFVVKVTPTSLCTLTKRFESAATAALVPCQILARVAVTSGTTRTTLVKEYETLIKAQSGHTLPAADVTILIRLAGFL